MIGWIILALFALYVVLSLYEAKQNMEYFFPGDPVIYDERYGGKVVEDHGSVATISLQNSNVLIVVSKSLLRHA